MTHPVTPPRTATRRRSRRSFGKIKKLPSGRYQASYLGPDGQRHNGPVTFLGKMDADQWLAMRQAEIVEHKWKPPAPAAKTITPTLAEGMETDDEMRQLLAALSP